MKRPLGVGQLQDVRNASSRVAEAIRQSILDGVLAPGARLREAELAEELGISRTPIREALMWLSREGLVELIPNRGARVKAYSTKELKDIYDLRAILEGFGARTVAERATRTQLSWLEKSCQRFENLQTKGDVDALVKENLAFHNYILSITENPRLIDVATRAIDLPLVYRSFIWYSPNQRAMSEHYHRDIVEAIKKHDGDEAERLMKAHLFEGRDFLIAELTSRGETILDRAERD